MCLWALWLQASTLCGWGAGFRQLLPLTYTLISGSLVILRSALISLPDVPYTSIPLLFWCQTEIPGWVQKAFLQLQWLRESQEAAQVEREQNMVRWVQQAGDKLLSDMQNFQAFLQFLWTQTQHLRETSRALSEGVQGASTWSTRQQSLNSTIEQALHDCNMALGQLQNRVGHNEHQILEFQANYQKFLNDISPILGYIEHVKTQGAPEVQRIASQVDSFKMSIQEDYHLLNEHFAELAAQNTNLATHVEEQFAQQGKKLSHMEEWVGKFSSSGLEKKIQTTVSQALSSPNPGLEDLIKECFNAYTASFTTPPNCGRSRP